MPESVEPFTAAYNLSYEEAYSKQYKLLQIRTVFRWWQGSNEYILSEKYATPRVTEKFPPIFFEWANRDAYRFDTLDLIKDALCCNVNYEEYEGTGILSNHAFSVIMCFKASKKCLEKNIWFYTADI